MLPYILFASLLAMGGLLLNMRKNGVLKQQSIVDIFIFILIVLFVGLRGITVGSDTVTYHRAFEEVQQYGSTVIHMEWGFLFINKIVTFLGGEFHGVLLLAAFMSLYFARKSISYFGVYNIFLSYFVLLCSSFFLIYVFSGIRQGIAMGIVLYSYRFIVERKLGYFLISIILASMFHTSAIIVLPIYYLTRKIPFILVVCGTICAFVFAHIGVTTYLFLSAISLFTGHYSTYAEHFVDFGNSNTGLGIFIRILIWLWVAYMLSKEKEDFKYRIIYNILCVGIICYSFCLGVDILIRLSEYFTIVSIIAIPYILQRVNFSFNRYMYCTFLLCVLGIILYSTLMFKDACLIPYMWE